MITTIHVFDFDGTLVDSSHRYRTMPCGTRIDLDYWIANEHKAIEDSILPLFEKFNQLVDSPTDYPIVATARIWDSHTEKFVEENKLKIPHVIARKNRSDTRGGAALKITGIKKLLNLKQFRKVDQIHVYEDNKSYLDTLCSAFNAVPHFFLSNQGH